MKIEAIDITLLEVESGGVAYYRLDDGMQEFLMRCAASGRIIGFVWDSADHKNFGVIMAEPENVTPAA